MKKILLLAATLLMGVCSWAQAPESGVYEIENVSDEGGSGIGRGYLVDYTSYANGPSIGDCPWTAHRAKHPEQKNGDTTCSYWYLYNAEDACYLFSLSTLNGNTEPKFLVVGSQSSKKCTWSTSKNAVEIVNNPNKAGSVGIRNAGVTATNEYLSMGCGTNSTSGCIMVDALTDGGAKLRFNTVEETVLTTEQKAVMAAGIALCQAEVTYPTFDAEKQYTLHATASKRGYLAYNPAETSKVGLADVTLSPYENKHPASTDEGVGINWKIEASTTPGKVYLYNTTCNKYLAKSGVFAVWAEKSGAQLLSVAEKSEGVCTFKVGADYLVASCGWEESQGAVRFQSNYENAVEFTVAEAEGTEPGSEKTTLSVTLLNGSEEISLSAESATSVATATGIKFAFANVSNESVGYAYAIYQGEEQEPIYASGAEYSIDSDDFDQTIHFAKDEQYKVVVSCLFDGPDFTYTITGTYVEEGDPTDEFTLTVAKKSETTYTVTASDETSTWYACVVPASTFEGLESEEDKVGASWSILVEYVADLTASDLYTGSKDINVAELYAEQNNQELADGSYILIVGGVMSAAITIPTDVISYAEFTYETQGGGEEGETVDTYTISSPRGVLFAGEDILLSTCESSKAGQMTDDNSRWVVVEGKEEHQVYLYNVGTEKFLNGNNLADGKQQSAATNAPMTDTPWVFYKWQHGKTETNVSTGISGQSNFDYADYPWVLGEVYGKGTDNQLHTINVTTWMANGNGYRLCNTSSVDPGNAYAFTKTGTVTKAEYDEIYNMIFGTTTGISAVAPVVAGKAIFNLQGQRIMKLQKGINIVGGQKVIK